MIRQIWYRFIEAWNFAKAVNRWRAAGHSMPTLAAHNEFYFRAEFLERFRDFASAQYLADKTELPQCKTAFIKAHLDAGTTVLDRGATAIVRNVILEMDEQEAYHPDALAAWEAETDRLIGELKADAAAAFGPDGISPLMRRVLRAG